MHVGRQRARMVAGRPRRLTRQEQSAATRQALIDATIESLIELGYERSTTTEIAERAGHTRGAQLHHFQTSAAMLEAAVATVAERALAELRSGVAALPAGPDRHAAALEMMWRIHQGPIFGLMLELAVHARTDPALREMLDPIEDFVGRSGLALARLAFAGDERDPRCDDAITVMRAVMRGLAVLPLLEPGRTHAAYWPICRRGLLPLVASAASRSSR